MRRRHGTRATPPGGSSQGPGPAVAGHRPTSGLSQRRPAVPAVAGRVHTGRVRTFVAAWPTDEVRATLAGLDRPPVPGLRWTLPAQWHVTLAFLGEVADPADAAAALAAAAHRLAGPLAVALGPATAVLGRSVLVVPARGLEAAAAEVRAALGGRSLWSDPTPYVGHLTLARARRNRGVPASLAGAPCAARWAVDRLCLVGSVSQEGGVAYRTVATAGLGPGPATIP